MHRNMINAAGVNVQRGAQVLHGHGGALNVPARKPLPKIVPPCRVLVLGGLNFQSAKSGIAAFLQDYIPRAPGLTVHLYPGDAKSP